MAVDVCTEISSLSASPRISFSKDLEKQTETQRSDSSLFDPNFDFDFCIGKSGFIQELPSADELFSNGKILPIEIAKTKETRHSKSLIFRSQSTKQTSIIEITQKKRLKEFLSSNFDDDEEGGGGGEEVVKPISPKSFWQFRRSASLNCESGRTRSLIRPLQFLSRSNSTGSVPNPKQRAIPKGNQKGQHWFKQQTPSPPFSGYYPYNSSKKPPLKKNCSRSYSNNSNNGNGVRVSPVLNIPHNCIAGGSGSLFGFGSLFCNAKAKKKKK